MITNYFHNLTKLSWICPIRDCKYHYQTKISHGKFPERDDIECPVHKKQFQTRFNVLCRAINTAFAFIFDDGLLPPKDFIPILKKMDKINQRIFVFSWIRIGIYFRMNFDLELYNNPWIIIKIPFENPVFTYTKKSRLKQLHIFQYRESMNMKLDAFLQDIDTYFKNIFLTHENGVLNNFDINPIIKWYLDIFNELQDIKNKDPETLFQKYSKKDLIDLLLHVQVAAHFFNFPSVSQFDIDLVDSINKCSKNIKKAHFKKIIAHKGIEVYLNELSDSNQSLNQVSDLKIEKNKEKDITTTDIIQSPGKNDGYIDNPDCSLINSYIIKIQKKNVIYIFIDSKSFKTYIGQTQVGFIGRMYTHSIDYLFGIPKKLFSEIRKPNRAKDFYVFKLEEQEITSSSSQQQEDTTQTSLDSFLNLNDSENNNFEENFECDEEISENDTQNLESARISNSINIQNINNLLFFEKFYVYIFNSIMGYNASHGVKNSQNFESDDLFSEILSCFESKLLDLLHSNNLKSISLAKILISRIDEDRIILFNSDEIFQIWYEKTLFDFEIEQYWSDNRFEELEGYKLAYHDYNIIMNIFSSENLSFFKDKFLTLNPYKKVNEIITSNKKSELSDYYFYNFKNWAKNIFAYLIKLGIKVSLFENSLKLKREIEKTILQKLNQKANLEQISNSIISIYFGNFFLSKEENKILKTQVERKIILSIIKKNANDLIQKKLSEIQNINQITFDSIKDIFNIFIDSVLEEHKNYFLEKIKPYFEQFLVEKAIIDNPITIEEISIKTGIRTSRISYLLRNLSNIPEMVTIIERQLYLYYILSQNADKQYIEQIINKKKDLVRNTPSKSATTQCLVCSHEKIAEINAELSKDVTFDRIYAFLKKNNINIPIYSITRHARNHINHPLIPNCLICNCKLVNEVDSMLIAGIPHSKIHSFLSEYNIKLSPGVIWNHSKMHCKHLNLTKKSKCLICNSIYVDMVNIMIENTIPQQNIFNFLKSRFIPINIVSSVSYHAQNHYQTQNNIKVSISDTKESKKEIIPVSLKGKIPRLYDIINKKRSEIISNLIINDPLTVNDIIAITSIPIKQVYAILINLGAINYKDNKLSLYYLLTSSSKKCQLEEKIKSRIMMIKITGKVDLEDHFPLKNKEEYIINSDEYFQILITDNPLTAEEISNELEIDIKTVQKYMRMVNAENKLIPSSNHFRQTRLYYLISPTKSQEIMDEIIKNKILMLKSTPKLIEKLITNNPLTIEEIVTITDLENDIIESAIRKIFDQIFKIFINSNELFIIYILPTTSNIEIIIEKLIAIFMKYNFIKPDMLFILNNNGINISKSRLDLIIKNIENKKNNRDFSDDFINEIKKNMKNRAIYRE